VAQVRADNAADRVDRQWAIYRRPALDRVLERAAVPAEVGRVPVVDRAAKMQVGPVQAHDPAAYGQMPALDRAVASRAAERGLARHVPVEANHRPATLVIFSTWVDPAVPVLVQARDPLAV
jgi:hypothetical protein